MDGSTTSRKSSTFCTADLDLDGSGWIIQLRAPQEVEVAWGGWGGADTALAGLPHSADIAIVARGAGRLRGTAWR